MAVATAFALSYSTMDLDKPILQDLDSTGVATARHTPGYTVKNKDGREWTYILFDSSGVAAVAGGPAVWAQTTTNKVVTSDVSDAGTLGEGFAGVFMSVLTDTYYGWIQTKGKVLAKLSSTCAIGSCITPTADGVFTTQTGTTGIPVGTSLEAGVANDFPNVMLSDK